MKLPLPPFGPEVRLSKYGKSPFPFYASSSEPMTLRELESMADDSIAPMLAELSLGYAETNGHPLLLSEIARLYGAPIREENILCFSGAQTGIFCMLSSLLVEDDHCIVVSPCYPSLENVPASICKTSMVFLRHERRWELDLDEVEDAVRPNTKLIVLNSPNSPTGSLISAKTQAQLIELATKHDIWIFSDEVYRSLELDPADRLPPMADLYEKGLSLGVMSKAYGLGGLCIGWIATQSREILEQAASLKHYLSVSNGAVAEIQAIVALRAASRIAARQRRILSSNIRLLDRFFADYGTWFEWVRPKSGCVGFVKFEGRPSVDDLSRQLIQQSGVFVMPASAFEFSGEFFRIGFGRTTMPESLERFIGFVEKNKNDW